MRHIRAKHHTYLADFSSTLVSHSALRLFPHVLDLIIPTILLQPCTSYTEGDSPPPTRRNSRKADLAQGVRELRQPQHPPAAAAAAPPTNTILDGERL